jgi:PAS domain S-box-containing protein
MIMTDAGGKIVLVNAEVERLFGYPRDELLGRSIDILVPTAERAGHGGHRASFVDNPESRRMGVWVAISMACARMAPRFRSRSA